MRRPLLAVALCVLAIGHSAGQVRTTTNCRPSGSVYYCERLDDKGRLVAEGECRPVGGGQVECEWHQRGAGTTGLGSGSIPQFPEGFWSRQFREGQRAAAEQQRRQLENQLLQEELRRRQLERKMLERDIGQTSAAPSYSLPEHPPSPSDKRWCLTDGHRYQCTFVYRTDCRAAAEANGLRCEFNPARN